MESPPGIQCSGKRYGQLTNSPNPPWVTSPGPHGHDRSLTVCKWSGVLEVHPRPPVNHRDRTRVLVSWVPSHMESHPVSNGLVQERRSIRYTTNRVLIPQFQFIDPHFTDTHIMIVFSMSLYLFFENKSSHKPFVSQGLRTVSGVTLNRLDPTLVPCFWDLVCKHSTSFLYFPVSSTRVFPLRWGNLLSHGFRNRLKCHSLQSNSHGFRNRVKCHLLQSIILSFSLIPVNVIDYHFSLLL